MIGISVMKELVNFFHYAQITRVSQGYIKMLKLCNDIGV